MTWELFGPKIQKIPAVATDEAGGLPATISEENPELVWTNYLTNPTVPAMAAIPTPPRCRPCRFRGWDSQACGCPVFPCADSSAQAAW